MARLEELVKEMREIAEEGHISSLADPNLIIRRDAIRQLGENGTEKAVPHLQLLVDNPDEDEKSLIEAIQAIERILARASE